MLVLLSQNAQSYPIAAGLEGLAQSAFFLHEYI